MKKQTLLFLGFIFCASSLFSHIAHHVFKEYDLRGKVGIDFQPDDMYEVAQAIGTYFLEKNPQTKKIVLGMDGRTHSQTLKEHISSALVQAGFDVIFIGLCTTPIVYYALHNLTVDAGLMITASHNPPEYNGIKICLGTDVVSGSEIKEIQALYEKKNFTSRDVTGTYQEQDIITPYINYLVEHFPDLMNMQTALAIDCGNGATGVVIPRLVEKMQWSNAHIMYAAVDGTYPHHVADPTVEKYMSDLKSTLATSQATIGIGFDGDGDRMAPMTKSGQLIAGDQLLAILSAPIIEKNPGAAVVFDASSSEGLIHLLKEWGALPIMSPTGHTNIKKYMKKHNALIGGEISCHFVFNDSYFGFDDGIYAALRLLKIMQETGSSLEELLKVFPAKAASPTYRIPCQYETRTAILNHIHDTFSQRPDAEVSLIDGVRVQLPYGWAIVRSSNTEPMLSLRFEGHTCQCLDHIKEDFARVLEDHMDCSFLASKN